ncbi:DNA mismatch repair endonuclease MutL [Pseudoalteromonas luteoviolacea]|uniref:DNA mismatch repair endonuclease MutL n=1 Tax=Pseudoalteromonas luteoviolacea TaxID=43657 RepID=UPI001EEEC7A2|nr:DNA mismatch repair endonuclease MutL [Pseudoalteromonas luteoviolacea]MCF6441463.1 DNA mismatch repair endonuclease MutL [Pseudoalteromonas luteoviolacea]
MAIEILPARLANQIAAGEVVERPASVVKELVENSIDAGATRIQVEIERGGHKLIRIRDNGSGIYKDELALALSRHATSKLKNLDDLEAIASLGFRGEALASISSVSRLTLSSKPEAQDTAWQACAEGRDMAVQVQPTAHPNGTTIEVKDLFFNTPARRKFLRTEKTEFSHIDELVKRIALSRFDVAITLTHNQKVVRQYRARQDPRSIERVAQVAGRVFQREASFIESGYEGLELYGWVLPLGSNTQPQYTYVNGRMMRDKLILHAIRQAFEEATGSPETPGFVIYVELDPRQVDVNVHPAKHEVRFHQARLVHDFIVQAVKQVVEPRSSVLPYTHIDDEVGPEPSLTLNEPNIATHQEEQHQSYRTPLRQEASATPTPNISMPSSSEAHFESGVRQTNGASRSNYHAPRSDLGSSAGQTKQVNVNQLYQAFTTEADNRPVKNAESTYNIQALKGDTEQSITQMHWMALPEGAVLLQDENTLLVGHTREGLLSLWLEQIETDGTLLGKALLLPVRVSQDKQEAQSLEKVDSWLTLLGFDLSFQGSHVMVKKLPVSLYSLDVGQCISLLVETCVEHQSALDNLDFWVEWLLKNTPQGYFASQHFLKVREKMLKKPKSRAAIMAKAVKIEPKYILDLLPKGY